MVCPYIVLCIRDLARGEDYLFCHCDPVLFYSVLGQVWFVSLIFSGVGFGFVNGGLI